MAGEDSTPAITPSLADQQEGAPPRQPMIMLAARFLLELAAFAAIALAGWRIGGGGITGGVLASIFAILAAALWGHVLRS